MMDLALTHLSTVLGIVLGIVLIGRVLRTSSRPAVSFAWLLAIVFVPYVGVPAYLLFGGRKIRRIAGEERTDYTLSKDQIDHHPSLLSSVVDNVLTASGTAPARAEISVEFLPDGETTYAAILDLIESAERTVHVMTFILARDDIGRAIVDALARKADEGVEVRLLLDAWGSWQTRVGFLRGLQNAGGKVAFFMPFLPVQRRWSANLRNHRKLVVVDGKVALMGGMNLAGEYMGPTPNPERWIDTAAIIRGAAAMDLEDIFLTDWRFATRHHVPARQEDVAAAQVPAGTAVGQVVASGPNVEGDLLYEAILTAMYEAQHRIWIVTPYFVPDEGLTRALRMQARLGRDVCIVVPAKSNHFFADLARGRFLRELHAAGVRLFAYTGRMMHAKHLVFDDRIAVIGSINFDMRSMYLNYEVALFMYTNAEIEAVTQWSEGLMEESVEVSDQSAGHFRKLAEDVSILVSPLL